MSSFVTSTRHDTNSTYVMDSFLPSVTFSTTTVHHPQQKYIKSNLDSSSLLVTSTPTANNSQSNLLTFDCLPQTTSSSVSAIIPIENLSIQHSIDTNNDWISPVATINYSTTEYNPQEDINFLFGSGGYNDLAMGNKDMSNGQPGTHGTSIPSESSSINEENRNQLLDFQHPSTYHNKGPAEQYRRFSMMDMNSHENECISFDSFNPSSQHNQHQQYVNFYSQQPIYTPNKEQGRSSMPNVFAEIAHDLSSSSPTGHLTWQQSGLLQKKPMPTMDEEVPTTTTNNNLTKYNNNTTTTNTIYSNNNTNTTSNEFLSLLGTTTSLSSPLKKHAKKRSMIDEDTHTNTSYAMPSVVSSMSEPIPTANWMQQQQASSCSRKRNKSIMRNHNTSSVLVKVEECHPMDNNHSLPPPSDMNTHNIINEYDSSRPTNHSNQVLAAMPRRQKLRYDGDNYTPKWVRYTGHLKEGYCDSCNPGKWLQLKNSAYWYHKQFYHGISSVSGKLFLKPIEQRIGKGDMIEGLCHQCHRFVPACNGKKKNNFMLWYRHAHKCHLYDKPKATTKPIRKLSIASNSSNSPIHTPITTPTSSTTTTTTIPSHNII